MTPQQKFLKKADRIKRLKCFNSADCLILLSLAPIMQCFMPLKRCSLEEDCHFSTHSGVLSAFGKQFVRSGEIPKKFHQALITAESARIQSDYDVDQEMNEADAIELIQQAEHF